MIIAVDFDNTLIENIEYPSTNYRLKKNARYVVHKLNKQGHTFILNTARYGWYFWSAIQFIKANKLPIKIKLTPYKINADLYIDDKNLGCKGINWLEIEEEVNKLCMTR